MRQQPLLCPKNAGFLASTPVAGRVFSPPGQLRPATVSTRIAWRRLEEERMPGRREIVAAGAAALMAGLAVVILAEADRGEVVVVRVQGRPTADLVRFGEPSTPDRFPGPGSGARVEELRHR
jgi:antitoxin (DNA-binding transcriptional repressor) of toxin-antitoxin stability system